MFYRTLQQQQQLRIPVEYANLYSAFWYRMFRIAYLTRFYIVQRITGLGDPSTVNDELRKTIATFNEIAESLPGVTVPDEITNLLLEYHTRLVNLVDSMLAGDQAQADENIRRLYELADIYATALNQFLPYCERETIKNFYLTYFQEVVSEVLAVKSGEFNKALDIFNRLIIKALAIGEVYARGLLKLAPPPTGNETVTIGQLNMVKDLRFIMAQIAYLSRFYIIARSTNIYEADYIAQRLSAIPKVLAQKMETILGPEKAEGFYNLLAAYLSALESLVNSILSNESASVEADMNELYQYSDQIAEYLASINPFWTKSKWQELLYSYNNNVINEAILFQTNELDRAVYVFEDMLRSALAIADYLAQGLNYYLIANEF